MADRGSRKKMVGEVVSHSMDKTAMVLVKRLTRHSTYNKYVKRRAKYMAHDPQNACRMGDKVRIIESRPISKHKRWRVFEIIEKTHNEA